MPLYEVHDIEVTLTVEVDGHTLTFTAPGRAKGTRYHGAVPRGPVDVTLESSVRHAVNTGTDAVRAQAQELIARMYPVTPDFPLTDEEV